MPGEQRGTVSPPVSAAWDALVRGHGSIVLVSSVLGLTGGGGPFRSTAYMISKGGLVAFTRALAAQGRAAGVRANCVAPGLVATIRAKPSAMSSAPVTRRQPMALAYPASEQLAG